MSCWLGCERFFQDVHVLALVAVDDLRELEKLAAESAGIDRLGVEGGLQALEQKRDEDFLVECPRRCRLRRARAPPEHRAADSQRSTDDHPATDEGPTCRAACHGSGSQSDARLSRSPRGV